MKLAGLVLYYLVGWIAASLFGGLIVRCPQGCAVTGVRVPFADAVLVAAPWALVVVLLVAVTHAATWLRERGP